MEEVGLGAVDEEKAGKVTKGTAGEGVGKSDLLDWPGGMPIDLEKKGKDGRTLGERLSEELKGELDREAENQAQLVSDIRKWQRQYQGRKKSKSRPWSGCANLALPETRLRVDTVFVRIVDAIFNRRRPVIVKARKPELMDVARQTEEALEWLTNNIIRLREKLVSPLLQQLKIGTAVLYVVWETRRRTIYRYADEGDESEPGIKKYRSGGAKIVKDVQTIYEGPNVYAVPREDFVISSDAVDIDDAYLVGFRKVYRKSEMDLKVRQGTWLEAGAAKVMSPGEYSENEKTRAENAGKELEKTEASRPYELWNLWVKYDVDDDGEPDDILVTMHRETGAILRAIYSPTFTGTRPFVKLVGYPVEFSFDGEGYCKILHSIQEEIDTMHNQRIDRMALCNSMMTITRSGSGLESFKIEPGKNYVCDDNVSEAFREIKFSDQYPSTYQEEAALQMLADKVTGNTPALQGMSLAERPVFRDTQTLLSESNKKFKSMIDNISAGLSELYYMILELYSQYEPRITYKVSDANGRVQDRSLTLPITAIRDGLDITLSAATEVTSQETRMQTNQSLYMMTSDYLSKLASTAQTLADPQAPPEFKKFLLEAGRVSAKLFRDILLDSDRPDAEELAVDPGKVMDVQTIMAPPPPPPQPPMPGGPQGPGGEPGGPGGPPPEMMGGPPMEVMPGTPGEMPPGGPPPEMMGGM